MPNTDIFGKMMKMEIKIASLPDRENLVAELWYDKVQWCEISQELNELILEIYPSLTGKPWTFQFEEALEFLQRAERRMASLGEPLLRQKIEPSSFVKQVAQMEADPAIRMEIKITSVPDRKNLVAELWYDKVMWAEISQEESKSMLEIYPHPMGKQWIFKFSEVLEFLQQAKRKLASLDPPQPKRSPHRTEIEQPSFAK